MSFEVPKAMTHTDIAATQKDFVHAARNAISAGCDGIEIHAGNGYVRAEIAMGQWLTPRYLFDQFHHSNGKLYLSQSWLEANRYLSEPT